MNNKTNRATDSDLEQIKTTGYVEGKGFAFANEKRGKEKFKHICDAISRNPDIATITFQKGANGEGLTFDKYTIPTLLLQNDTLSLICDNSQIDRAYFLFKRITGISFLLIVEKTRCDSIIYYDKRELFEEEAAKLFSELEDEYYVQKRQSFKAIKRNESE